MKKISLLLTLFLAFGLSLRAQGGDAGGHEKAITALIDRYAAARESSDTSLLQEILTDDIDQLVSSGEWRTGMGAAVAGMQRSSAGNPGQRILRVEKIRMLSAESALADARYEIRRADGTTRKMWSTFIVVYKEGRWRITAIRNMLPAGQG